MVSSIGFCEFTICVLKLNENFLYSTFIIKSGLANVDDALVHLRTLSSPRKISLLQTINSLRPATVKLVHNEPQ